MSKKNTSKETDNSALRKTNVRCSTCGKFMRELRLIERIRLETECNIQRTHICINETITFKNGYVEHK